MHILYIVLKVCMHILYIVFIAYCLYTYIYCSMGSWKPVAEKGDRSKMKHALMLGGIWSAQITWTRHIGLYKACDYVYRQVCVCVCELDAYRYAFIAGRVNSSLGFEAFWRASAFSNHTEEPNLNFDITKNTLFIPRTAPPPNGLCRLKSV